MNFPCVIPIKKEDIQSCIENLKKIESHEESLKKYLIYELDKAKSIDSVGSLKALIERIIKRVNYNSKAALQTELNIYKEKVKKYKNKVRELYLLIDKLKDVAAKLNDQLKITEEDQAKLLIRQLINVVPTQMYWKIFSEKKKNKKTFWLSEIDNHLNKLPDTTEFDKQEKSKKLALFEEFRTALGGDWKEMEYFMKNFKDDVGVNQAAHPIIGSKNKILDAVNILTKSGIINEDDAAKILILANVWEDLNNI